MEKGNYHFPDVGGHRTLLTRVLRRGRGEEVRNTRQGGIYIPHLTFWWDGHLRLTFQASEGLAGWLRTDVSRFEHVREGGVVGLAVRICPSCREVGLLYGGGLHLRLAIQARGRLAGGGECNKRDKGEAPSLLHLVSRADATRRCRYLLVTSKPVVDVWTSVSNKFVMFD